MYRPEAQCPLVHIPQKIKYLYSIICIDTDTNNELSLILHKCQQLEVANSASKTQSKAIICINILNDKNKYDLIHSSDPCYIDLFNLWAVWE